MLDALLQDIRNSARSLRRAPGFSAVVVLTLALAIGIATTLFSVLNALVLRSVPVREPERLAVMSSIDERGTEQPMYLTVIEAFRARQHSFESLAMYSGGGLLRVEARGTTLDQGVEGVTPDYFEMVGARAAVGRLIERTDSPIGNDAAPVIVISDRLWRRVFGGDRNVIGETMRVEGALLTIIGVTQPGFSGLQAVAGADLFVSIATLRPIAGDMRRPIRSRNLIGRLSAGVTIDRARSEALAEWPSILASNIPPGFTADEQRIMRAQHAKVDSIRTGFSFLRRTYADPMTVLVGLSVLLLAVGCVNLAGLQLARVYSRHQELAVRLAIGASRARIVQQRLVEGLILSSAGALVGLPFAWWGSQTLAILVRQGATAPLAVAATPDGHVLIATAVVVIVTGMVVGAWPALITTRRAAQTVMHAHRNVAPSGRAARVLLIAQIASSLSLVVGAGLFAGSLTRLRENGSGYEGERIVWTRIWMQPGRRATSYDRSYYFQLATDLRRIAGVKSVAFSQLFPSYFAFALPSETFMPADTTDRARAVDGLSEAVSPDFFATIGIVRLRGRDFTWDDDVTSTPVAIANASLARKLFPDGDAVGRRVRVSRGTDPAAIEIVGVVDDAPIGSIREPHRPVLFKPMLQDRTVVPNVHLRATTGIQSVRSAVGPVVASLGRHFVRDTYTLDEQVDQALVQERLIAMLSELFALLALSLGCLGVYALMAYTVTSRTREIGLRMSLGATGSAVIGMIASDSARIALCGVGIGIPCAIAVARLFRSLLYGVSAGDPVTLIGVGAVFVLAAVAAGLVPAWRASRIDPMAALRCE